jgi:Rrf2 family protein
MSLFKLTKRADYALALLALLAKKTKGERVSLSDMKAEGMPKAFMAQIAKDLVVGGVLKSKEGKGGGYSLLKEPGEVTVKEALEVVEGEVLPVDCDDCEASKKCNQKSFMAGFADEIGEMLESYTLIDLLN